MWPPQQYIMIESSPLSVWGLDTRPFHADPDPGLEIFADPDLDPRLDIFTDLDLGLDLSQIFCVFK